MRRDQGLRHDIETPNGIRNPVDISSNSTPALLCYEQRRIHAGHASSAKAVDRPIRPGTLTATLSVDDY